MKKILAVLACAVFCSNLGFASFSSSDIGTSGAAFLKLGAGARPTAMGDCFAGISDDSTAIYWNPAGLNQITGKGSLTLMHAIWFEDISYDWVSYARPYKNLGVFGIGVQYLSYGSLKKTDNTGLELGDFSPTDMAISISYARKVKDISLGAMKKINDKLTLGAAAQNIGTKLKYVSEEESLPMNVKIGGAYTVKKNWLAVLDINAPIDNDINYGIGTEYIYKLKDKIDISGRAGYNTRNSKTGGLNGITVGFGVKYQDYCFDYAFVPYGDLGNTNRISFSVQFK
jgi:hypothetical protein